MISFSQEPNRGKTSVFGAYMRRLSGKSRDSNSETKHRTESSELRSRAMTTISELGNSATIRAFASSAAFRLRAGSTSLAPRFASTRAVSAPIPDVAPGNWTTPSSWVKQTTIFNSSCNGNQPLLLSKLTSNDSSDGAQIGAVLSYLFGSGLGAIPTCSEWAEEVFQSIKHLSKLRYVFAVCQVFAGDEALQFTFFFFRGRR